MKKLIILLLGLVMLVSASAADFYSVYKLNFPYDIPEDVLVLSGRCHDSLCSAADPAKISVYNEGAMSCFQYFENGDASGFENCMANYKEDASVPVSSSSTYVIVRYNYPATFGYLTYFLPKGDTYVPYIDRINNMQCSYDICVDENPIEITFTKIPEARAEINDLNIENIDSPQLPIQIEVPVEISQTVCSAYSFTYPDQWKPIIPQGYSDFSANTEVDLVISSMDDGTTLYSNSVTIPIRADTCAGIQSFSWTPPADLENKDVKFRVQTEVVDNQVINGLSDYAEAIKTIYPEDLNNLCWVNVYNLRLTNSEGETYDANDARIVQGEPLYLSFDVNAYLGQEDNNVPINYRVDLFIDGNLYTTESFEASYLLNHISFDLSGLTSTLPLGDHEVRVVVTPQDSRCEEAPSETLIEQITIIEPPKYSVTFHVTNEVNLAISDAQITLSAYDNSYEETKVTDSSGVASFNDVSPGRYVYTVQAEGYNTVSRDVYVNSDLNIYQAIYRSNFPPVINLPEEFSKDSFSSIVIDLRKYIYDPDNSFDTLSISYELENGSVNVDESFDYLVITPKVTDNAVSDRITINVTDPDGSSATDSAIVSFHPNLPPEVNFYATETSGEAPFTTNFVIETLDREQDNLTCLLEFGDGGEIRDGCENMNTISHTYEYPGSYIATLYVGDGSNVVTATQNINVFVHENHPPFIEEFEVNSTNGGILPTDIVATWRVSDSENDSLSCTLRIEGKNIPVSCDAGSYTYEGFNSEGYNKFSLIVSDGISQVVATKTLVFENHNVPPTLEVKDINAKVGVPVDYRVTASDPDGDVLTFSDTCSLFDINRYTGRIYFVPTEEERGTHYCSISVSDGVATITKGLVITIEGNDAPIIESFKITNFTVEVPTNITFVYDVYDPNDDQMYCDLVINNGESIDVPCEAGQNSYTVLNFNNPGANNFTLRVSDGEASISRSLIINLEERNLPPVIEVKNLTGTPGVPVRYQVTAIDPEGDSVYFTDDCSLFNIQSDGLIYFVPTEEDIGVHVCNIIATDGHNTVTNPITIFILTPEQLPVAVVSESNIETTQGTYFTVDASGSYDPSGYSIEKYFIYEGDKLLAESSYSYISLKLVEVGNHTLSLVVENSEGWESLPSYFNVEVKSSLTDENAELIINKTVVIHSPFTFSILVKNETLDSRVVRIKPEILYDGVVNTLATNDGFIDSSLVSIKDLNGGYKEFTFSVDLRDFKLRTPKDVPVTFRIKLFGEYGTILTLEKAVVFTYPKEPEIMTSISGSTEDIVDYMTHTLNELSKGYNDFGFEIVNNEDVGKSIKITITSPTIQINYQRDIKLAPYESKFINIPIYISKSIKPGVYPIRITIHNGNDKLTKYTFIKVSNQ